MKPPRNRDEFQLLLELKKGRVKKSNKNWGN